MAGQKPEDPMASVPRRTSRDTNRASIPTNEAATRLGKTRQRIFQMLGEHKIDGYGINGKQRTRWYVYLDSLPPAQNANQPPTSSETDVAEPAELQDAFAHVLNAQERFDRAFRLGMNIQARHPEASADVLNMLNETWQLVSELIGVREQALTPTTVAALTEDPS